ncbi:SpaA isopeptide-forming pilin-related protein [Lactococcus formosensis]|uniref:SpaA isopeptide-forming pilin-related protein n=1 Tax=Lactococcus formosensis TaxID=1281486 RepID=UPI002890ACB6|nr:SpaA isopeptide-forming pilin-related protein [Lactococcus formosensis]MDT2727213.1 SpaA isopeptide-forming pilin-related protein [Lactococcus formosensis]
MEPPIKGATFTLRKLVPLPVSVLYEGLTTDENGKIIVENLSPGYYEFTQISTPEGYSLPKIKTTVFYILEYETETGHYAEDKTVTIFNKVTDPTDPTDPTNPTDLRNSNGTIRPIENKKSLPKTGERETVRTALIGFLIILSSFIFIKRLKKE